MARNEIKTWIGRNAKQGSRQEDDDEMTIKPGAVQRYNQNKIPWAQFSQSQSLVPGWRLKPGWPWWPSRGWSGRRPCRPARSYRPTTIHYPCPPSRNAYTAICSHPCTVTFYVWPLDILKPSPSYCCPTPLFPKCWCPSDALAWGWHPPCLLVGAWLPAGPRCVSRPPPTGAPLTLGLELVRAHLGPPLNIHPCHPGQAALHNF